MKANEKLGMLILYIYLEFQIQFTILVIHGMQALHPKCDVSSFLAYLYMPNIFIVYYLFYGFYKKSYTTKIHKKWCV